ncbi:hypothetical protein LOK49_LG07G02602 [Camellia lanceoleosa]|uniref:Uncharacterized protein n=1 Tax=Camellia lanceoleosa TaxID=1840588 RepID=A0ACC0H232_9ERIC|nr:hypothetical protein LOK49_LG07G02602 [Camellia lanceoleosa]
MWRLPKCADGSDRSLYAKREEMLAKHANLVAGGSRSVVWLSDILEASLTTQIFGKSNCERLDVHRYVESLKRVVIVNEGAGDAVGLLGVICLVQYLSQNHVFGKEQAFEIVVDVGTGITAVGLGLGAICLGRHSRFTNLNYFILTKSKILKIIRASMELFHGGSLPLLRKYPKFVCSVLDYFGFVSE